MEYLQKETVAGKRRWSDRTTNRVMAHLKTFTKWVHKHQPFPPGNPMEKIGLLKLAGMLDVDFERNTVRIVQKGGQQRRCQVSREGMRAIRDYIDQERAGDAARWRASPALFLPAASVAKSAGRLAPVNVNTIMTEVCRLAGIEDRTPHSARHGMGVHIIKKTGNPRAVQRQLGHTNPSTSMQYMQFTREELQAVLDER